MELREALTQITEIRLQLARTEVFRGYRAMPVAFSGLLALTTAGFQAVWLPEPLTVATWMLKSLTMSLMESKPFSPAAWARVVVRAREPPCVRSNRQR